MASIAFSSTAEEILGKLAGSVFQDSYIGMQVRGLPRPKNPQTQLQQLRRGNFRLLSSSWRFLTTIQQATWISFAGTTPEALRLFIGNNINLILVEIPIINSYTAATTPVNFPVTITELTATTFLFIGSSTPNIVPANTRLLVYATSDKQPTLIFDNPSQYTPITYYNAGTDLSSPTNIFTAWTAHYGTMRNIRRVCIKAVLISTINGDRGGDEFACATSPFIATSDIINSDGTFVIDSDGTFITAI